MPLLEQSESTPLPPAGPEPIRSIGELRQQLERCVEYLKVLQEALL